MGRFLLLLGEVGGVQFREKLALGGVELVEGFEPRLGGGVALRPLRKQAGGVLAGGLDRGGFGLRVRWERRANH